MVSVEANALPAVPPVFARKRIVVADIASAEIVGWRVIAKA
jgi:hypothetical protein